MRPRAAVLCLCYLFLWLGVVAAALAPRSGRQLAEVSRKWQPRSEEDVLVVGLLDGRVVAVDSSTGSVLWTFDSGAPMLSVQQSEGSPAGTHIFPGVDGALYAYHGIHGNKAKLERLPITLPELVDASPSLTDDGSLIVGQRMSSVFMLDAMSGRALRVLTGNLDDRAAAAMQLLMDPSQAIVMGREDYTVRSMHVGSGMEAWNATFSRFMRLGPKTMPAAAAGELGPSEPLPPLPRFIVSADNSLQAYDAETGFRMWSISFDAPPVAAFSSLHQGLNHLDPAAVLGAGSSPGPAVPGGAPQPLPGPSWSSSVVAPHHSHSGAVLAKLPGQLQPGAGGGVPGARVLVGALNGVPYVLPADHLLIDEQMLLGAGLGRAGMPPMQPPGWQQPNTIGGAVAAPPSMPALMGVGAAGGVAGDPGLCAVGEGGAVTGSIDAPGASMALAPLDGPGTTGQLLSLMREEGDNAGLTGRLVCPPGLHVIAEPSTPSAPVSWLPNNTAKSGKPAPPALAPASRSALQRLPLAVQLAGAVVAMVALVAVGWVASRAHSRNQSKAQLPALVAPNVPVPASPIGLPDAPSAPAAAAVGVTGPAGAGTVVGVSAGAGAGAVASEAASAVGGSEVQATSTLPEAAPAGDGVSGGGKVEPAAASPAPSTGKRRGRRGKGGGGAGPSAGGTVGEPDSGSNYSTNSAPDGAVAPASDAAQGAAGGASSSSGSGVKSSAQNGKQNGKAGAGKGGQGGGTTGREAAGAQGAASKAAGQDAASGPDDQGHGAGAASGNGRGPSGGEARDVDADGRSAAANRGYGGGSGGPVPGNGRVARLQQDGSLVIGRLRVGPGILGYGSAGTVVYEGVMDGRAVAVKRLLRQFYDLAKKEIEVLIMSDEHPNVVRCFAMEEDREFVYLALERCRSTLNELMGSAVGKAAMLENAPPAPGPGGALAFAAAATGPPLPSARCLELMHQVALGLAALHERSIVHRDLKPHNVLITDAGRAKLSDMGLSKQLVAEQSSFESHGAGGSSGWQAPEQLIARGGGTVRQTRAMDVFSLGCVLHYCLTGGSHPFGDSYARDGNILHQPPNLSALSAQPEAANLLAAMLLKEPAARPSMAAVLSHPLWWSAEQRLQFLVDISDRVENEDREPDQTLLAALESHAAAGIGGNWGALVDPQLVANLGRYRRYDYTSLRDLLRVVRNKRSHFREMPSELQAMLGPLPTGFLRYFSSRFPGLIVAVYVFGLRHLRDEPSLAQYWPCGAPACEPFLAMFAKTARPPAPRITALLAAAKEAARDAAVAAGAAAATAAASTTAAASASAGAAGGPAATGEEQPAKAAALGNGAAAGGSNGSSNGDDTDRKTGASTLVASAHHGRAASESSMAATEAPGTPSASGLSASSAPVAVAAAGSAQAGAAVVVGYEVCSDEGAPTIVEFPQRPGKQTCEFFVKTGHCKFGDGCMFDHPPQHSVPRTALGLPLRPDQPVCAFYLKNNECKFGAACRFHHPLLKPIYAGSARTGAGSG